MSMSQALQTMRETHEAIYRELNKARSTLESQDQAGKVDIAFLCREVSNFADDIRKESDKLKGLVEKLVCLRFLAEGCVESPIRGQWTTATPQFKKYAKIPKRTTPEYVELMRYLDIPDDVIREDMVRPHWPGLTEFLTFLVEENHPLPDGINPADTDTKYSLLLRAKKGGADAVSGTT